MFFKFLQSLIPLKEEWDMKSDEKKTSESYRLVCEENKEIMEVSGFNLNFLSHKLQVIF
jgi:mediator of RNA polymerase II transcription subunit 30